MTFAELRWASFRIFSYSIVFVNILTFGSFLYVIGPYTSYFFFGDLRFWKYFSYFHKYFFYSTSYLKSAVLQEGTFALFHLRLTAPPMNSPDPKKLRIAKNWKHPVDTCGDCSTCCNYLAKCCFYDRSQKKCMCYGTLFWRFFNCGRFPINTEQMNFFNCTKFEFIARTNCVDVPTPQRNN